MFDMIIDQMDATASNNKVSKQEYEQWKKLFSFDALKGKSYGKSFLDYFKIKDYRIQFERDWERCDKLIRNDWVTVNATSCV